MSAARQQQLAKLAWLLIQVNLDVSLGLVIVAIRHELLQLTLRALSR